MKPKHSSFLCLMTLALMLTASSVAWAGKKPVRIKALAVEMKLDDEEKLKSFDVDTARKLTARKRARISAISICTDTFGHEYTPGDPGFETCMSDNRYENQVEHSKKGIEAGFAVDF